MKKRSHNRVVFKAKALDHLQTSTDLDKSAPAAHLVRMVKGAIERMD